MKIAYIDQYVKGQSQFKDTLTIPSAMRQLGCEVVLISCSPLTKVSLWLNGFEVLPMAKIESAGWNSFEFDGVVFVSRLNAEFTPIVLNIKKCGLRLVIKADTDGTWGYPIPPNYLRARPLLSSPLNILRHIKWRLPLRHAVGSKCDQLRLAETVVVESPGAAVNATFALLYWGQSNIAKRVCFISNPISPEAMLLPVQKNKNNTIVTVGRWDDRGVKNTQTMLQATEKFLAANVSFDFEIIGAGLDVNEAEKYLGRYIKNGRVSITPEIPYKDLQKKIGQAKVILVPSTLESFCFVALEALCAGTSIVVTPIESLIYLTGGGRFGSVARSFGRDEILAALTYEVQAWEQGLRNSEEISDIARKEFHPNKIARQYIELFNR